MGGSWWWPLGVGGDSRWLPAQNGAIFLQKQCLTESGSTPFSPRTEPLYEEKDLTRNAGGAK